MIVPKQGEAMHEEQAPKAKGKKRKMAAIAAVVFIIVAGMIVIAAWPSKGVVDVYSKKIETKPIDESQLDDQLKRDGLMLGNVLGEIDVLEKSMQKMNKDFQVSMNANKGLYTVEQEKIIAQAYARYLVLRKALFHIAFRYKDYDKIKDKTKQADAFLLAYSSGLTLYRNAVVFVVLFKDQPNARKKLNEADPVLGIPAGTMHEIYANITTPANVQLAMSGVEEFNQRLSQLKRSKLLKLKGLGDLIERLQRHEKSLEGAYKLLAEGKRDILWTRVKLKVQKPAYEAQTFVSMMVGHIRSPIHEKPLTPKSVDKQLRPLLKPGDVLLTRRDGYLSNTFLPGNWGHAAMYLGTPKQIQALGADKELMTLLVEYKGKDKDGLPFEAIEAIGEGVRYSSLEFALNANKIAILRPTVDKKQVLTAIKRAMKLRGTPYDFSFDLASQDKIICTELVYRAYAPYLETVLEDVMGRKTLKPDGLLRSLDPTIEKPKATFVAYGHSKGGVFQPSTVDEMMKTVQVTK